MRRYSRSFPSDWETISLNDLLMSLTSGSRPKGGGTGNTAGIFSLGGEHITDDGGFTFDNPQYVPKEHYADIKDKAGVSVGDILINKDGAKTGKLAIVRNGFSRFPACINEHIFRLRINDQTIEPEYLFAVLLSDHGQKQIQSEVQGSAQGGIIRRFAKFIEIGYPRERKERQAILNYILATDRSLNSASEELQAAQRLKTALMQQLFTKGIPGRHRNFRKIKRGIMPASWELTTVNRIAYVGSGVTLNQDRSPRSNGYRYLTVVNVQRDYIDLTEERYLELRPTEVPSRLLKENDILVVEGHANSSEIGRAAMVDKRTEGMTFQNHLFRIRVNTDEVIPAFLLYSLNCSRVRRHWNAICNTSSGLNTINRRQLGRLEISKPSRSEQEKIVALIEGSKATARSCEAKVNALTILKKSIHQNLLTGKVRINAEAKI